MSARVHSPLSAGAIREHLQCAVIGRRLLVQDEVDSTNRLAMALAAEGAPDGTVVVADSQTQGRGRLGRGWLSPPGMNLYLSIVLTRAPATVTSWLSLMAGVAVVHAIEDVTGHRTQLKWPNDVLGERRGETRKLAGILAETSVNSSASGPIVVVGIGINVNMTLEAFPEELRATATSLLIETGHPVDRVRLLASLLGKSERLYEELLKDPASVMTAYGDLCGTIGRRVRIDLVGEPALDGVAEGIAPDGALKLCRADGAVLEIRAGDVVHLRDA